MTISLSLRKVHISYAFSVNYFCPMHISGNQKKIQKDLRVGRRGQMTGLILWVRSVKSKTLSQIHCYLLAKSKARSIRDLNSTKVLLLLSRIP